MTRSDAWRAAARESAPESAVVMALTLTHPDMAAPARLVSWDRAVEVDGETHQPTRFEVSLPDDPEERDPRAELRVDNVGRVLMRALESSDGAAGSQVELIELLVAPDGRAEVEWRQTLGVARASATTDTVTLTLGFEPLLGRPAVLHRHDPATSPGLF